MRTSLVLTVIGDDRPGLVEALAVEVLSAGANWEESRMARLAGKFAGLLRVTVESSAAADLARRLKQAHANLTVVVEQTAEETEVARRALNLELVGNDRPGIIRDISRALADQHINIDELETGVTSAPMTGDLLFRARARLEVPPAVTVDALRTRLEKLAGELMVDLELEDAGGEEQ